MLKAFLSLGLLVCLASSASAARVGFMGTFTSTSNGAAGLLAGETFPVNFGDREMRFDFDEATGNLVSSYSFLVGTNTVWATGGNVNVIDSGAADTVTFNLNVNNAPTGVGGQFSMTFTGDLISGGSVVSQANFDELMGLPRPDINAAQTGITFIDTSDFVNSGIIIISGQAFAVPEPTSFGALALLGCVGLVRRRRS